MGTKYTTQSASGYNSSPPPDDGTQVASNLVTWAGVKTKLADPIKTLADAENTALVSALDLSARAISTPDTAVASDHWKTLQVTGATTITLSSAASMGAGYEVGIFNAGVGVVTVTPGAAADTINGVSASVTVSIKGTKIFRTNQALTGYNVVGGYDPQTVTASTSVVTPTVTASTSVVTPLVGTDTTATLQFKVNGTARWNIDNAGGILFPQADGAQQIGGASNRISQIFTPIIDTGTTGSGALKTNNGTTVLTWANDLSTTLAGKLTANAAGNVIAPSFESAETAVGSAAGNTTIAHGLGAVPRAIYVAVRNKSAELGYSVGDEVFLPVNPTTITLYADATNIGIVVTSSSWSVVRKDTFVSANITPASWKYVVRACK